MYKILLVDDELSHRRMWGTGLKAFGFEIETASNGHEALSKIDKNNFDLILLDVNMSPMNGFVTFEHIRKKTNIPIIFLSSHTEDQERAIGYRLGCEEYVSKSESVYILKEICESKILKFRNKNGIKKETPITIDDFTFHLITHSVYVRGKEIKLNPKEYDILLFLLKNKNQALSREEILEACWKPGEYPNDRSVDWHIVHIRTKLIKASIGNKIKTIRNYGYAFK